MRSERGNSGASGDTVIINHFFYAEAPKNCANVVTLSDSCVFRPVLNRQSQSPPLWASIGSLHLNRVARYLHAEVSVPPPPPLLAVLICIALSSASSGIAQQRRALPTHLVAPATEAAVAPVQTEQSIRFGLTLPLRNRAALEALIHEQRDPSSPHYRQYLTAEHFLQQYGPTQADYDSVVEFAKSQGFTVTRTYANCLLVNVSGSPTNMNKTFAVKMQVHQRTAQTGKYYAPDVEPSVDSSLPILSVESLSTRDLPQPHAGSRDDGDSDTTGSGQSGQFLGSDIRATSAPGVTLDGEAQTVGLVEFGPYHLSDVQMYFTAVNQPLKAPIYNVLLDVDGICSGTPSSGDCDDGEEVIDIQLVKMPLSAE